MLFDNPDYNYEISFFKIPGSDFSKEKRIDKFYSVEEGFLRGNMMTNEYTPYKNMTYKKLEPETERECLLFQVMAYSFALNDLNLYLDLHPEDLETFEKFQRIVKEEEKLECEYAKKYGPMTINESKGDFFDWVKNPWPWDKTGGSQYV